MTPGSRRQAFGADRDSTTNIELMKYSVVALRTFSALVTFTQPLIISDKRISAQLFTGMSVIASKQLALSTAMQASFIQRYEGEIVAAALSLVAGIILTIVAPALVRQASSVLRWVSRRVATERSLYRQYRKNLASDVRQLKLLGMAKPRDLEEVFVPLRIREPDQHIYNSHEGPVKYPTLNAALSYHPRMTVLGDPGAGKTSIARHAVLLAAEGKLKINGKSLTPLYIALNEIKQEFEPPDQNSGIRGATNPEEIIAAVMELYGFPRAQAFIARRLRAGSCLVIFDGFDELASSRRQDAAAKMIKLLHTYHAENRIVVTSREAGFRSTLFSAFETLEIEDLPLEQAHIYIGKWFVNNAERGARLMQILDDSPRLKSLASNPLMLAVICITYEVHDNLPRRRADLYAYCIDTLNTLWDQSRGVDREAAFSPNAKITVLKNVAFDLHSEMKVDCSTREFLSAVRKYLPKAELKPHQDGDFVKEVIEHTGLVRKKSSDTLAFQHLTFQEYLAACKLIDDEDSGLTYLVDHAADPWWSETVVLAAGIQRDATDLIERIHAKMSPHVTDEICVLLGRCLTDADLSDFTLKDQILGRIIGLAYPKGRSHG